MTVKERLKEYLKHKGITERAFAKSIGVSSGYVSAISKSIQPDKMQSISIQYPDLDPGWLLTGEGEMLKEEENEVIIKGATPETIAQLAQSTFSEQLVRMFQDKEIAPYSLVEEKEEEIARLNEEIARLNLIVGRYEGLLQSHGVEYKQTGS